jgi:tetratricopeptide (TPR) repeat protein
MPFQPGGGRSARVAGLVPVAPALLAAVLLLASPSARAQEGLSPLPPPVTRSLYRSQWFEFLSAFSENDGPEASGALDGMVRAARKVGVHHLSDFSRTAVFLGRRAEKLGQKDRAARAYDAALRLDPTNPDALVAGLSFQVRQGRILEALRSLPAAVVGLFSTHESRVAILSSVGLWTACAIAGMLLATVLALGLRHFPRAAHDIRETAHRVFGRSAALPLALGILGLPLFLGFGPFWLVLYWGALLYPYTEKPERTVLVAGLLLLAVVPPMISWLTIENIEQRSPLLVAAVDLAERREDASAEDGLRQASAVFPEDSDVWFLLGVYAERAGDYERAQIDYGRAIREDPNDYRPILNRGNVRFTEGDYGEAIRDYVEASKRAPEAPEIFYNLSLARGEAYDFDGQARDMARAREISPSRVNAWADAPTLFRVVPAGYSLVRAHRRIAEWNSQPKSRRLPGHGATRGWRALISPWLLPPLAALALGSLLERLRRRGLAAECQRCGRAFCHRCRRYGDPALYCSACARMALRKESVDIGEQAREARALQRRLTWRHRARRIVSLLAPGSHAFGSERPAAGAVTALVFFFGLSAAIVDMRLFDPLTLPVRGPLRLTVVAGALLAGLVWVRAQLAARRPSSGS